MWVSNGNSTALAEYYPFVRIHGLELARGLRELEVR